MDGGRGSSSFRRRGRFPEGSVSCGGGRWDSVIPKRNKERRCIVKSALIRLQETRNTVSPAEREIVDYILEKPEEVANLSIYMLAEKTYASPSTIIRLCHEIGLNGYRELRRAVACEIAVRRERQKEKEQEISRYDSIQEIIDKITDQNRLSLEKTRTLLNMDTVQKCVELICRSRTVCLFGMGSSLCVARDAYLKFLRLNKPCVINDDWHAQLVQAWNMNSEDVGLVISYSGRTAEVIECMKAMRENRVPVIAVTRCRRSPVAELSTYNIYVAAEESTFRTGAMSSRISQLNVIDILYTAYANSNYEYCLERLTKTHIEKPKTT